MFIGNAGLNRCVGCWRFRDSSHEKRHAKLLETANLPWCHASHEL